MRERRRESSCCVGCGQRRLAADTLGSGDYCGRCRQQRIDAAVRHQQAMRLARVERCGGCYLKMRGGRPQAQPCRRCVSEAAQRLATGAAFRPVQTDTDGVRYTANGMG